jgi:LmbE family N-acetylglucosaminyl deacetylase
MLRRSILAFLIALIVIASPSAQLRVAPVGERPGEVSLALLLRKLASTGTFMETTAHPDDEDNALLSMLGHGRGMRTVLVTATRGNGGQNEIGPELFEPLGVLRTEELLAVHRFDGAEQYFTRAIDFGFSFSVEESIQKWGHDEIVGDYVHHIRATRPDVIAGFLCGGTGGGQHHQASAQLTIEAFRAAADPAKFPEQINEGLHPWQAKRVFCTDTTSFGPQARQPPTPDLLKTDVSAFDAALGRTYAELGLEARSMHKCQGTSQLLLLPGQGQGRTYRLRDTVLDQTGVAPKDLFDGIDVSLHGLMGVHGPNPPDGLSSGLDALSRHVSDATQALASGGPKAAIEPLAAGLRSVRDLRKLVHEKDTNKEGAFEVDFRLKQKEQEFEDALRVAAGVTVEALADDGVVTRGETLNVTLYATAREAESAALKSVALSGFDGTATTTCQGPLEARTAITCKATVTVPATTHFSTPYWKPRTDSARYDFEPDVPFGVPFRPSPFHATYELTIGGEPVTLGRVVQYRYDEVFAGEKRTELKVAPMFNVRVTPDITVVPSGTPAPREVRVTVSNSERHAANGTVSLKLPGGWTADPATAPAKFAREDEQASVRFRVTPPARPAPGEASITATFTADDGTASDVGYDVIEYPHIHRRHYIEAAATRLKVIDVAIAPNLRVGYIMGVGDQVPQAIAQLGASVEMIDPDMLSFGDLSRYDVIVTGVRAYERRADLRANNQRLLDYAANGGTVLVQYNKFEFNQAQYGPYPAKVSSNRVTDENAPIEILVPDDPVFNRPNKIGPESWANWVQERGLYFLGERDPRYVDLVRSEDPFPYNAGPKTGALVEARVGKGRWIYIGLGLWRELPAGVDGAYRLMANLLSLGKSQ